MIKSIKAILAQDKEKFKVPRKVQDLIPIKNIWPDGIFKVGNKFSKSFRFSDINYLVASREDKESMFLTYSELLNSLDSGATTKITINNHRLNRSDFEESILMPMKQDGLDEYRKEYNDMLLDKATGANGITQEKYITITVAKKDIEEARAYFARIGADLTAHFANLGSKCVPLNAVERLRILHDFYRPGDEAAFSFDMNRKARLGHDFRDYICPDSVERTADHIKLGEKYARVLFLKDYASYIKDSMFSELTELNRNLMLSIDVIPIPTDEAVREVERLLLGVETNITGWQRRQNQNNNFSAVVPYDMELQRKESKEFLDDLTTRDQRMMFAVVTMVITADTKEQLDLDTETVLSTARKHMCQMATLKYQQTDGLNTVLPIGTRKINAFRTLTTESLAVLMPFKVQEIMDKGGIYFGENAISHNLIMCNKANLLNQSAFLLGVPGSGKSFSAKELITFLILNTTLSVICSRAIYVMLAVQSLGQLQNRYPNNLWAEIVGNLDVQLMLGCTDEVSAEYFSARSGDMSVEINSTMTVRKTIAVAQVIPQYRQTEGQGRRRLLTLDEVLRIPNEELLVVIRGHNVLKLKKFDYADHPLAKELTPVSILDYTPPARGSAFSPDRDDFATRSV